MFVDFQYRHYWKSCARRFSVQFLLETICSSLSVSFLLKASVRRFSVPSLLYCECSSLCNTASTRHLMLIALPYRLYWIVCVHRFSIPCLFDNICSSLASVVSTGYNKSSLYLLFCVACVRRFTAIL